MVEQGLWISEKRIAQTAVCQGINREPELISYQFATDGRFFVPYDIPIIGYSPADEAQAHTANEHISIAMMDEALHGYVQLLREF